MSMATKTLDPETEFEQLLGGHLSMQQLSGYFGWKIFLDRTFALLLLIPGLPLIGFLVVLVRMTSKGPGIFCQTRVGKDGKTYRMYKIRSMSLDAEAATGAVWTAGEDDPRVTRVGAVLRRLHLDEFPQLFNVLKGEMSLIGPRPERPEFVSVLSQAIPGYTDRLAVLPGISGLAQINLPPDTDLDSVRRKQMLDLQYIDNASLWLDVRMSLWTLSRLIGVPGNFATRILQLYRSVELEELGESSNALDSLPATPQLVAQQAQVDSNTRSARPQNQTTERSGRLVQASTGEFSPAETSADGPFTGRVSARNPK